jgi:hypothetical protein
MSSAPVSWWRRRRAEVAVLVRCRNFVGQYRGLCLIRRMAQCFRFRELRQRAVGRSGDQGHERIPGRPQASQGATQEGEIAVVQRHPQHGRPPRCASRRSCCARLAHGQQRALRYGTRSRRSLSTARLTIGTSDDDKHVSGIERPMSEQWKPCLTRSRITSASWQGWRREGVKDRCSRRRRG